MIDLHCHLLPGIDDGADNLETAIHMARIAAADGIHTVACTPHIYPGLYPNTGPAIRRAVERFREQLASAGIPLTITCGADIHLTPDLASGLDSGALPSLHGSRYFLLEPPHHVAPPQLEETVFGLATAGYVPVITHPERLTWIEDHYDLFPRLMKGGAWLQVTAGSLTGQFGAAARYWGERLLDEGLVHLLATDAHGVSNRPPVLSKGYQAAVRWVGSEEAGHLVKTRPMAILDDLDPSQAPLLPVTINARNTHPPPRRVSFINRLFHRG